ncbi:PREDICTED: uncharacterized protein LOC109342490 [Lupinus angustifolius]|uniref:uncharacterized protein LOC109342490 n=1 Tax=Lupinus angustifolius TaxID=3871 RepID=UPI00092E3BD5|nr:PREDICTED: uncharacterized protein LOC109342490 [Lupinus angustifolius]
MRRTGGVQLKPTRMSLQLANRSIKYPEGFAEDVLVKVDRFLIHVDFIVIDISEDVEIPLILGRTFMRTTKMEIETENGKVKIFSTNTKKHLVGNWQILKESVHHTVHKIMMEDDYKPCAQPQRRLNPTMKEVVRKEVAKMLEAEIRDKSGKENQVANHLSRFINKEVTNKEKEIVEEFPDEKMFLLAKRPWFTDISNYKALGIIPENFNYQQRKKFLKEVNRYVWYEPYLFKDGTDSIIRRCVDSNEA